MAKENIIKAIQRTRDKDGNLVPVFPYTSADSVLYDVDKQITVADKIDGGIPNGNSVTYNNIFSETIDSGRGMLKIDLPNIQNNHTIDMDISLSSALYDNTVELTKYNVPLETSTLTTTPSKIYLSEMDPNGLYILTASSKTVSGNTTYSTKLYQLSQATVTNARLNLNKITHVLRARFSKNSGYLIIFGTDNSDNEYIEVHRVHTTGGASFLYYKENSFTFTDSSGSPVLGKITYFDTCGANGVDYLIANDPTGTRAISCFTFDENNLIKVDTLYTNQSYMIENEIRVSPGSSKIAILSKDGTMIHCMGRNVDSMMFQFRTVGSTMNNYAWGSSSNNGTRVGVWKDFVFNSNSTKLYGTYVVGSNNTLRVCDVSNAYGSFEPNDNNIREITTYNSDTSFDIGANVYKPVPRASIYNSTSTTFDYVSVGNMSGIGYLDQYVGAVIRAKSSASSELKTISRSTTGTPSTITETAFVVPESSITWIDNDRTTDALVSLIDLHIHPTNGYGYAIIENVFDIAIVPMYIGDGAPQIRLTSNPLSNPIIGLGAEPDISYDGSAIAYVDNIDTLHVGVKSSGDRYTWRSILASDKGLNNRLLACRVIDAGAAVICIYQTSVVLFVYRNGAYVETPIAGNTTSPFSSTNASVFIGATKRTITNGVVYYDIPILRVDYNSTGFPVLRTMHFNYSGVATSIAFASFNTYEDGYVIGAAFSAAGDKFAIYVDDMTNSRYQISVYKTSPVSGISHVSAVTPTTSYRESRGTSYNNIALIDIGPSRTICVYCNHGSTTFAGFEVLWDTNQLIVGSLQLGDLTTMGQYISGIQYISATRALFISTVNGGLYAYRFNDRTFTLVKLERAGFIARKLAVSETGDLAIVTREYNQSARLLKVAFGNMSGTLHVSATRTELGWDNVTITSDNPELAKSARIALENDDARIIIGENTIIWDSVLVNIDKFTIIGENARKYSYRLGYDVSVIESIDNLTNITSNTAVTVENSDTYRLHISGYVLKSSEWSPYTVSGYHVYKIELPQITSTTTVNVDFADLDSWLLANSYGFLSLTVEHDGYAEIFAGDIPDEDIIVDIDIFK